MATFDKPTSFNKYISNSEANYIIVDGRLIHKKNLNKHINENYKDLDEGTLDINKLKVNFKRNSNNSIQIFVDGNYLKLSSNQGSYNLPKRFLTCALERNILIKDSNLEYSRKNIDGNAYVLNEIYKFELGSGVLWLIGEKYANVENKFIASINDSNNKFQLYRAVYNKLSKEGKKGYDWFVDLIDKNIVGSNLILKIDEERKILTLEVLFSDIFNNIPSEYILDKEYPHDRIIFGAPGTGKSYDLNLEKDILLKDDDQNYERVTFHPDYSYANFVGTYKPVPVDGKNETISYEYVPGPFMRILVESLKPENTNKPYLLIIEEINRANVASVFGDIFQLLDRNENGESEYSIQTSEDMRKYLISELGENQDDYKNISLPSNLYIWATMNSADQGVYMMDSAFKRRWNFSYKGINDNEEKIDSFEVCLGSNNEKINWNKLRKAINKELLSYNINEDKLIGPFFIPLEYLPNNPEDNGTFIEIFKNKIIMYLFEDVAKAKRKQLFNNKLFEDDYLIYSDICDKFDEVGIDIFCENITRELR